MTMKSTAQYVCHITITVTVLVVALQEVERKRHKAKLNSSLLSSWFYDALLIMEL